MEKRVAHVARKAADRKTFLDDMEDRLKAERVAIGISDAQSRRYLAEAKEAYEA